MRGQFVTGQVSCFCKRKNFCGESRFSLKATGSVSDRKCF